MHQPVNPRASDIHSGLGEARAVVEFIERHLAEIESLADSLASVLRAGGCVFTAGNGGSALEAQHLAAELIGRFHRDRQPLASLALSADAGVLTALANDYGYESVFSRQVEGLGRSGDALVVLSTSGESQNLVSALREARRLNLLTVALSGGSGGAVVELADHSLVVPNNDTARIQEGHLLIIHLLAERIEQASAG